MQRRSPIVLGLISLLGVSVLAYQSDKSGPTTSEPPNATAQPAAKAPSAEPPEAPPSLDEDDGASPVPTSPSALTTFHLLPDGSPVPALKDSAPDRVKLGVILFKYQGAQGASDSTRSKQQAQALADKAIKTAKTDFAAAVQQGDRGSSENIGWMGRRILERSVEYAVFTLEKGATSTQAIDTPRGFWVVKRLR